MLAYLLTVVAVLANSHPANAQRPPASVDIVGAFWNAIWDGQTGIAQTAAAAKDACADRNFTYIRFGASAFWPKELSLWLNNSDAYWSLMDQSIDALEAGGCTHLIPSLFWNSFCFSDLLGEPLGMLAVGARGEPSRSWQATLDYIQQFVTRYAHRPSIYMWELGNEWNLILDLDQSKFCNNCGAAEGAPTVRTRADNISTADWQVVSTGWAAAIRSYDPLHRPIGSGHGVPRPDAEHLRASYWDPDHTDWRNDTYDQFVTNVGDIHTCCDMVSMHIYPGPDLVRWGNLTDPLSADILLYIQAAVQTLNAQTGKDMRIYVGEYGQLPAGNDPASFNATRPFVDAMLSVLAATAPGTPPAGVPPPGVAGLTALSMAWVWEFSSQNATWSLWPGATEGVIQSLLAYNAGSTAGPLLQAGMH